MRKSGLTSGLALTVLAAIAPGCVPRPVLQNHSKYHGKFAPRTFTEKDNPYKGQVFMHDGVPYLIHDAVDGRRAVFNPNEASVVSTPGVKGSVPILVSGERNAEGKLVDYVFMQAEGEDGDENNFLDYVVLRLNGDRANLAEVIKIEGGKDLDVVDFNERIRQSKQGTVNIEGLGRCYIVSVPTEDIVTDGSAYNWYAVVLDKNTVVQTDVERVKDKQGKEQEVGRITITSMDNIWRPNAVEIKQLKALKAKADAETEAKRKAAEARAKADAEAAKKTNPRAASTGLKN